MRVSTYIIEVSREDDFPSFVTLERTTSTRVFDRAAEIEADGVSKTRVFKQVFEKKENV